MPAGGKREGSGRKPLFKKTTAFSIRIDTKIYEIIPDKKQDFIREAINEKLEKEEIR